jgi:hypothetical protein
MHRKRAETYLRRLAEAELRDRALPAPPGQSAQARATVPLSWGYPP